MAQLLLSKAAKLVGVSRQTIYRHASAGRLSVTLAPDPSRTGQPGATEGFVKVVDTAELERVFGPLKGRAGQSRDNRRDGHAEPATTAPATAVLQAQLEAAQAALATAQTALAEAKEREARLLAEARDREDKLITLLASQTRLLEHKAAPKKRKKKRKAKAA